MNLITEKILINSIHYLLKRDGFVIVPEWGAFFLQPVSAKWDDSQQIFYPPSYQLLFNQRINYNDGVLAIYLSKEKKCSYFDVLTELSKLLVRWQTALHQFKSLQIDNLGEFILHKEKINFQSNIPNLVFPDFFGLQNISVQQNNNDNNVVFSYPSIKKREFINTAVKTLILLPLVLTLALLPLRINNYIFSPKQPSSFNHKIKLSRFINDIQDIADYIDTTTNLKVALQLNSKNEVKNVELTETDDKTSNSTKENKKTQQTKIISTPQNKYFVIIGSFTNNNQAMKFLSSIKMNGLILNCDGKRRVALDSFYENQNEALKALNEFKIKNPSFSGWILKW